MITRSSALQTEYMQKTVPIPSGWWKLCSSCVFTYCIAEIEEHFCLKSTSLVSIKEFILPSVCIRAQCWQAGETSRTHCGHKKGLMSLFKMKLDIWTNLDLKQLRASHLYEGTLTWKQLSVYMCYLLKERNTIVF